MTESPDRAGRSRPSTPSLWPAGFAAGIVLVLIGLVTSWIVVGVGAAIAILSALLWTTASSRDLRDEDEILAHTDALEAEAAAEAAAPAPAPKKELPKYGRNVFLERATLGIGGVIGAAVTAPIVGFAVVPAFVGQKEEQVNLGPLDNFPEGKWVIAHFLYEPFEPKSVGRRTAYIRNNGFVENVPSLTILSNRCVHLGCPVQPSGPVDENSTSIETEPGQSVEIIGAQPSNFSCPCHGGSYDLEGNRVAGPPVRALDRYRYLIEDGNLVLEGRFSVSTVEGEGADAKIKAYRLYPPGTHVDGPDQWMYPFTS